MLPSNSKAFFDWFSIDPRQEVHILGCHARYATMYAQQVRALNLVAALWGEKKIQEGTQVAVIGGGAAGLTASAAAALLGAKVTLLEKLDGLMELQRNNRQRWIHPHIYDWPDPDVRGDRAQLPILDWSAGYAETVAEQIEKEWHVIRERTRSIEVFSPLRSIELSISKRSPWVKWAGLDGRVSPGNKAFPIVIVAVGLGLEPDLAYQWSYWQEDDIDASLQSRGEGKRWLVSGYGDSALTDLMRLCIKRFRHAELPALFAGRDRDAVESVTKDLREINRNAQADDPKYLTEAFRNLETRGLEEVLADRRRTQGFRACLTGRTEYIYDPHASTLNRLILCLLEKKNAFSYLPGPIVGKPKRAKGGFKVVLGQSEEVFERLLFRHGPEPAIKSFRSLRKDSEELRSRWKALQRGGDTTRIRNWRSGLFGPEDSPAADVFQQTMKRLGVTARALTIFKELMTDGRSSVTYQIEGLKVLAGELKGMRFRLESIVGVEGEPELNAVARQLGEWVPDPQSPIAADMPIAERLNAARESARVTSGVLQFKTSLKPDSEPVSFGLTILQLNADALSHWEFEQFYGKDQSVHFDYSPIHDLEYYARVVWFPIETLKVQLTFPSGYETTPVLSVFNCPEPDIAASEVVFNNVLYMGPRPESRLSPSPRRPWKRATHPAPDWTLKQSDVAAKTWELLVSKPAVGSCYSLDWTLPGAFESAASQDLEQKARAYRNKLLAYRPQGVTGEVRQRFLAFSEEVRSLYADPREGELFEIVWMTYNDAVRLLEPVDAVTNSGDPDPQLWGFKLPFGLGLAGAAYKGSRAFVYVQTAQSDPEYFLEVAGFSKPEVLIALPLDHPDFDESAGVERSRQCIGVIDISSSLSESKLLLQVKSEGIEPLANLCAKFTEDVHRALMMVPS